MRRTLLVLTVAAVMAAMILASALPVMAATSGDQPPGPPTVTGDFGHPHGSIVEHSDDGACSHHFGGGQSGGKQTGGGC